MSMLIYKITNKLNGKVYIGQTRFDLERRKSQHIRKAHEGVQTHLYSAMRKYGVDNFIFEKLCDVDKEEDLNELERFYIHKYNSVKNGYNMIDYDYTKIIDLPEVKAKFLSKMRSPEMRERISNHMKEYRRTHPFTEEHRKKLSQSAKGNHNWGTGDTRSIGCYCILEDGEKKIFHSYRDAWRWWSEQENPFDTKTECVYQRKIKDSIEKGYYTYHYDRNGVKYEYPKWFKCE